MRVAVIVPRNRLWRWHQALIADLMSRACVEVFVDDHAPRYPALLRFLFCVERRVFKTRPMAWPATPDPAWRAAAELKPDEFCQVVNLAEHHLDLPNALEVRYDGVADTRVLIGRLMSRGIPVVSVGASSAAAPNAVSYTAIDDKLVITRGLHFIFARCRSLIDRALVRTASSAGGGTPVSGEAPTAAGLIQPLAFTARMLTRKVTAVTKRLVKQRCHWSVALRQGDGAFRIVEDDNQRYYADPFLFARDGRTFLFVEEVPSATGKGVISVAEVIGDRLAAPPVPVLERPYHLSYPFVLAEGDAVYMLPESGANASLELYRAIDFPWRWELDRTLAKDIVLSDATPLYHAGRWWLFASVTQHDGTGHDELCVFYADSLVGSWIPHARNPVKSDCRSARPAGRIVQVNGRLFRPAQDCSEAYGVGIVWLEITVLTPDEFQETEVARWHGRATLGVEGLHTIDHCGSLQAIDILQNVNRGVLRRSRALLSPLPGSTLEATGASLGEYLTRCSAGSVRVTGLAAERRMPSGIAGAGRLRLSPVEGNHE